MKPEFASDRAPVRLHGLVADSERRGDRLISFTFGQQLDDGAFSPRERTESCAFEHRPLCKKSVEERFGDQWREIGLAPCERFDGLDNSRPGFELQDIPARARREGFAD